MSVANACGTKSGLKYVSVLIREREKTPAKYA